MLALDWTDGRALWEVKPYIIFFPAVFLSLTVLENAFGDPAAFLAQADLQPISIEKVNWPKIWSLVTCVKD